MPKIIAGDFVKRQTPESRFSHTTLSWEELAERTTQYFEDGHVMPGPREGVSLVRFPPLDFFCGVVEVETDTPLVASFESRREGEQHHIVVVAKGGDKLPAKVVDIVIYHRDVLAEEGPVLHDADWEIISINARPSLHPEPMTPVAMARNMLGLVGGTFAEYTAAEFAHAIIYWSQHAMRG